MRAGLAVLIQWIRKIGLKVKDVGILLEKYYSVLSQCLSGLLVLSLCYFNRALRAWMLEFW